MDDTGQNAITLPTAGEVRSAIRMYLDLAYGPNPPPAVGRFIPPGGDFDPCQWLMRGAAERDPADAPLENVRSFALRLGNTMYPHMKLRLSRPPKDTVFIFSVDAHDAFLHADPSSSDYQALEALKKHNSTVSAAIMAAWDAAGLPTERNYLRRKIRQARDGG